MKQKAQSDRELNENGNCCGVTRRENCGTKGRCVAPKGWRLTVVQVCSVQFDRSRSVQSQ